MYAGLQCLHQCIQGPGVSPVPPWTGSRGFRRKSVGYRGFGVQGYKGLGRPQADRDFGSRGLGRGVQEFGSAVRPPMNIVPGFRGLCCGRLCPEVRVQKTTGPKS